MVLDMYFGPFLARSEGMFFQKMAICPYPFLAVFDQFWHFLARFGPWNLKCTKLDHLGGKGTKIFGKNCPVALIEIWIPQTPQKPPLTPKHP